MSASPPSPMPEPNVAVREGKPEEEGTSSFTYFIYTLLSGAVYFMHGTAFQLQMWTKDIKEGQLTSDLPDFIINGLGWLSMGIWFASLVSIGLFLSGVAGLWNRLLEYPRLAGDENVSLRLLLRFILVPGLLVVGLFAVLWIVFSPALERDRQAINTERIMKTWKQEDADKLWNDIGALVAATPASAPRRLLKHELPQILQEAGFKSAKLSSKEFIALHGGSSFGVGPALVIYELEPSDVQDPALRPFMRTSVGIYTRGEGWQSFDR